MPRSSSTSTTWCSPLVVVEELDQKKARLDEVGTNARMALRLLGTLGASQPGGLRDAVALPGGGTLRIELNRVRSDRLPDVFDPSMPDNRILSTCLNLSDDGGEPVLVTKDAALRIKGAQLGALVQDYRGDTVPVDELYSGIMEVPIEDEWIDRLFHEGKVALPGLTAMLNEFVVLRSGPSRSAIGKVVQSEPEVVLERTSGHPRALVSSRRTSVSTSRSSYCSIPTSPRCR